MNIFVNELLNVKPIVGLLKSPIGAALELVLGDTKFNLASVLDFKGGFDGHTVRALHNASSSDKQLS